MNWASTRWSGDSFDWCRFFFVVPLPSPFQIHFVSLLHELCAPPFSCRFLVVVYTIHFCIFWVKYYFFRNFSRIIVCWRHIVVAVVGSADSLAHCLLILYLTCLQLNQEMFVSKTYCTSIASDSPCFTSDCPVEITEGTQFWGWWIAVLMWTCFLVPSLSYEAVALDKLSTGNCSVSWTFWVAES
jgi:hypothetical protein